jgi:hypothetical protein
MKIAVIVSLLCLALSSMALAVDGGYGSGTSLQTQSSAFGAGISDVTYQGSVVPRNYPIPGTATYPIAPNEFLNDSKDGNYISITDMFPSGTIFTKKELVAMLTPVDKHWYESLGIDANFHNWTGTTQKIKNVPDTATMAFVYNVFTDNLPHPVTIKPIGSDLARVTDTLADSWSLIARIGLNGLRIPNCNSVLLTGQGVQKVVKVKAYGASLGYTHVNISDGGQTQAGAAVIGIGATFGEAGRRGNPFIQASYLPNPTTVITK